MNILEFEIIAFDCDSTLSRIEGIDECAQWVGLGTEMAQLTHAAMNGELPLAAVYQKRLSLIQPTQENIEKLAEKYIAELVEGVIEIFEYLQHNGKSIHIISGGLRPAILPLARLLKVPENNVHAVDIYFQSNGDYLDFEQSSPLARNGGKAIICEKLKSISHKMLLIGDGLTDLEAQSIGVTVIGFGGVIQREIVKQKADDYIQDFRQLIN